MSDFNSTPLIVLGMHRSGTSMMSGMLNILGVHLGENRNLMEAQPTVNAKGFWEHTDIVSIHEEVFALFGSSWDAAAKLPRGWQDDPRMNECRHRLIELFDTEFRDHAIWGFKDPRLCRLLPLWLSIFEELRLTPKIIHITRHPVEVARSLAVRNKFSTEYSLLLWLNYVLEADAYSQDYQRSWITYEELNCDWNSSVKRIGKELNLDWPASPDSEHVIENMSSFVSKELWHNHAPEANPDEPAWIKHTLALYNALASHSVTGAQHEEIAGTIQELAVQLKPLLSLHDEVCQSLVENAASLYGYVKKFQKENLFLHDKFTENTKKLDELYAKNKSLDQTNSELFLKIGALELQNKNLRTLGFYGISRKLRKNFFK